MFINCLDPQYIYNKYLKTHQFVSCGKCPSCQSHRADQLKMRLQLEARAWKHVIFFTLTYNDKYLPYIDVPACLNAEVLGEEFDDELKESLEECSPLVNVFDGKVPVPSKRDIQLFIKKIRKNVCDHEQNEENRFLRYFVASEYGPTGLRPHYHGLLFTNSEFLAKNYYQVIDKAWSYYDPRKGTFDSFGFIRAEFSKGNSAAYCAAYCTVSSHLPRLLRHKIFRPFQLYSKCPPLGSHVLQSSQIEAILKSGLTRFTCEEPSTGETVSLPLWRYLENCLFPKIRGYSSLSIDERIKLYTISVQQEFGGDFETMITHFLFEPEYDCTPLVGLLHKYFKDHITFKEQVPLDLQVNDNRFCNQKVVVVNNVCDFMQYKALKQLWSMSTNFMYNCNLYGIQPYDMLELIDKHYALKDYEHLVKQLVEEEQYLTRVPKEDPGKLPFLIDIGFAENLWNINDMTREFYFEQFGFDPLKVQDFRDTSPYKEVYDRCRKWQSETHKTRCKNEKFMYNPNLVRIQAALDSIKPCSVNVSYRSRFSHFDSSVLISDAEKLLKS